MNWTIWLAFGLGLFVGANLGVLIIGLLVTAREDREIKDSMIWKRRDYAYFN